MNSSIRVSNCKLKTWTLSFIISELLLFALILSCLCSPKWIYSDFDNVLMISKNDYKISKLRCGLIHCFNHHSISFDELSKNIKESNYSDSYKSIGVSLHSIKSSLSLLNKIGLTVVILYSLCLFTLTTWLITLILFLKSRYKYWYSWISIISSCVSFWIASIIWFALTPAQFKYCNLINENGPNGIFCSSTGPILAILIMILFLIITFCYLIISIKFYRRLHSSIHKIGNNSTLTTAPCSDIKQVSNINFNPQIPNRSQSPVIQKKSNYRARGNLSLYEVNYNEIYKNSDGRFQFEESEDRKRNNDLSSDKNKTAFGLDNSINPRSTLNLNKSSILCEADAHKRLRNMRISLDFDINNLVKFPTNKFLKTHEEFEKSDGFVLYDDEIFPKKINEMELKSDLMKDTNEDRGNFCDDSVSEEKKESC